MKKIKLNIQMFASTNKTTNYDLPQFIGTDKPSWLGDVNSAMSAIDTAMHTNATTIAGVQSTIQTLNASLDSTNQSVTSLSNSLDTLDGRVTTQGGTITSIDGRVATLENDNSINKAKIETNSTYSTDEIKVGTWIDGKPLYRKVVVKDNVGTSVNAGYEDPYIDTITKTQFITVTSGAEPEIIDGDFNDGTKKVTLEVYKKSSGIDLWFNSTISCTKLIITLEYTKTTD